MSENELIRYFGVQLQRIENVIHLTKKVLSPQEKQPSIKRKLIRYCYKNDEMLGFTHEGKLYLNGEKNRTGLYFYTQIYLTAHIFLEHEKYTNSFLYLRAMEIINSSIYFPEVKSIKFYNDEAIKAGFVLGTKEYDDYFKEETLATIIGNRGLQFITESRRKSFKDWSDVLWSVIDKELGLKNITEEHLKTMDLKELSRAIAAEILKGEKTNLKFE